jgi:hypothetical protein
MSHLAIAMIAESLLAYRLPFQSYLGSADRELTHKSFLPLRMDFGRVTLGGCPPRVPTDPYVLALEHTVPQVEVATDGRSNGPREPWQEDSDPLTRRNATKGKSVFCCGGKAISARYAEPIHETIAEPGCSPSGRSSHSGPGVSGSASVAAHRQNRVGAGDTRLTPPGRLAGIGLRLSCVSPPTSRDVSDPSNG